jgi:hypothetical protein
MKPRPDRVLGPWFPICCLALFLPLAAASGFAQAKPAQNANAPAAQNTATRVTSPQPGDTITVPAGTQVPLELTSAISSRNAYVGQPVYFQTVYPVDLHNRIIIPAGTYVEGKITEVVRPGHVHRRALLGLRFDSMVLPSGLKKEFAGTLAPAAGNGNRAESRIKGPGDKGRDAETIVLSSAEGAGSGAVFGAIAGRPGAGAAAGAAGGAIYGTILTLARKGKELILPRGYNFQLEFYRPLVFYRYQLGPLVSSPSGPAFTRRDPGPG